MENMGTQYHIFFVQLSIWSVLDGGAQSMICVTKGKPKCVIWTEQIYVLIGLVWM